MRVNMYADGLTIDRAEAVAAVRAELSEDPMIDTIVGMSAFQNRHYQSDTGVAAAEWLADRWGEIAMGRDDVTIELINHSFAQPSVAMTIRGATAPDEIVIIGGHLDSIAEGGTEAVRANPAVIEAYLGTSAEAAHA